VKNDFSPQLATAPPGAGKDSHAEINEGEDDRVVAENFLAPGLEIQPFCKGHTVADLPGRGEGGGCCQASGRAEMLLEMKHILSAIPDPKV